ncbi:MAG: hypothetical protein HY290_06605 [Planctomycetia bacterium]|nr:hypothetical protein [Planctomycetia bacterium]
MELQDALAQLSEIRLHVARTEPFRGYRAATAGFSAAVAISASALQALVMPAPVNDSRAYIMLWVLAAMASVAVTALEMVVRCRRSTLPTAARMTWLAVEQFLPCTIAGALLTLALVMCSPESTWQLPGLWSILFSLGVFASSRLLPRPIIWVAWYYLVCGVLLLAFAQGDWAFSPWAMAIPFGGGQALASVVLYFTLERNHGRQ